MGAERRALLGLLLVVLLAPTPLLGREPAADADAADAVDPATDAAAAIDPAADTPDPNGPYGKFVHEDHRTRFLRNRVSCMACHPIGMTTGTDDFEAVKRTDERILVPAKEICHDCHTGELRYPRAPNRCDTCHEDLAPLLPEDHGPGWERDHAWASLRYGSSCDLCHSVSDCTTCHDRRDQGLHRVHSATFRSTHGIEARTDPSRCQRCHLQSSCEACHAGRGMP